MPPEGIERHSHLDICSFEELRDIAAVCVALGVRKIRVTGGEPLVRRGIVDFSRMLKEIPGVDELCITTNGSLLSEYAVELKKAGVDRLNVSLDTLRPERFNMITRLGSLNDVLDGLKAAEDAGFERIKINCVLLGGINDDEIPSFVDLTRDKDYEVRFIERMPIGFGSSFGSFVPATRVLEAAPQLEETGVEGVARRYTIKGYKGSVGLITPLSNEFCSKCNRIRLTSDGKLKPCLHSESEIMLRGLKGKELEDAVKSAILSKPEHHHLVEKGVSESHRSMNEIGG